MDNNRNRAALWPQAGSVLQRGCAHAERGQEVTVMQGILSERVNWCLGPDAVYFVRSQVHLV